MRLVATLTAGLVLALASLAVHARAQVGQPAPAFSLIDSNGTTHALADFKGRTVVLEWTNAECPFVKKHYAPGNMQTQQGESKASGVVWLTINSGAPGKQGHVDGAGANAIIAATGGQQAAYLLDPEGAAGRAYGAKTTPHMYVIDGEGVLRYAGAIDSNPSADPDDIAGAKQYVRAALADLAAGRPVAVANTQPYGCAVKYAN
jgi:peroxiredoxin